MNNLNTILKGILVLISISITPSTFGQGWIQVGQTLTGEYNNDHFGTVVDLSYDGLHCVVSADENSDNGTFSGHVRVFEWDGTMWSQVGLDINGEAISDFSGRGLSINADGTVVAIGAPNNAGSDPESGHVRVYEWDGTVWNQKGTDLDGENDGDLFGGKVSINSDGSILVVSGVGFDLAGSQAGYVQIYEWSGTAWIQKGTDVLGQASGDLFGASLDISDDGLTFIAGAPENDDAGIQAGNARVFNWSGAAWVQTGSDIPGQNPNDNAGRAVTISGDATTVAIGSPNNAENGGLSGQTQLFEWNGSTWIQKGSDIEGESSTLQCGFQLGLNQDGSRVTVSYHYFDGTAANIGQIRVFEYLGSSWTQLGGGIDGSSDNDLFGFALAFSADGNTVIGGSKFNDDAGNDNGHARVFFYCESINTTLNESICAGDSIVINGTSYNSPVTGATETFSGIGAFGCDSVVTLNLTVTALPLVTLGDFDPDTVCVNHTGIFLPPSSPTTGTYTGAGVVFPNFDPSLGTLGENIITYTVTDGNNCSNSETATIFVDGCAGIEDLNSSEGLEIYPNPTKGGFVVQFSNSELITSYTIFNLQGEVLRSETKLNSNKVEGELNEPNGAYIIQIKSVSGLISRSIITKI